jgi:hypothetical protein
VPFSTTTLHFRTQYDYIGTSTYLTRFSRYLLQTVDVIDNSHPSTSMLPAQWHVQDEMYATRSLSIVLKLLFLLTKSACRYNFKSDPRAIGAIVILAANESSYTGALRYRFNARSRSDHRFQILALVDSIKEAHIHSVSLTYFTYTTLFTQI